MRGVWRAGEAQAHSGEWLGWSAVFGADEWPELFHHVLRCLCHVQGFGVGRGPALGNSQCSYRLYRHPTGGRALNPIPFDPRQPCPYRVRPRLLAPCPWDRCDRHGTCSCFATTRVVALKHGEGLGYVLVAGFRRAHRETTGTRLEWLRALSALAGSRTRQPLR